MDSLPNLTGDKNLYLKILPVLIGADLVALGYMNSPAGIETSAFYLAFTGLMSFTLLLYHYSDRELDNHYFLMLSTFFLTVAGLRAFVGLAGIGTPRSIGQIGPFTVGQIWLFGFHLHHYYLGTVLFLTAEINHLLTGKSYLKPFYRGIGAGLLADELGIIITGATYYNSISYIAIVAVEIALMLKIIQGSKIRSRL